MVYSKLYKFLSMAIVLLAMAQVSTARGFVVTYPPVDSAVRTTAISFTWSPIEGADRYSLWLGTSADDDEFGRYGTRNSWRYVAGLPRRSIVPTLRARIDGRWQVVQDNPAFAFYVQPAPVVTLDDGGTTLNGSIQVLNVNLFTGAGQWPGATKYTLWLGTTDDPDSYGRWTTEVDPVHYRDGESIVAAGLPTDGSGVEATLLWYGPSGDTWRWHRETPRSFVAASQPNLIHPEPDSVFSGSSVTMRWADSHINTFRTNYMGYQWWFGTAEDLDAYGRTTLFGESFVGHPDQYEMDVVGLPLDSSQILATGRWFDGTRWRTDVTHSFIAGSPKAGVWGECTPVDQGRRPRLIPYQQSLWQEYTYINGEVVWPYTGTVGAIRTVANRRADIILRDGCASDNDAVSISGLQVYTSASERGVYLYLAPDSGAAEVSLRLGNLGMSGSYAFPSTYAIHPDANIAAPVFIALPDDENFTFNGETWNLDIQPLDPDKPVRVSEIRMARDRDDVTRLRKLRFNADTQSTAFVAMNGDLRAQVTAELEELFGPGLGNEGYYPAIDTCGYYSWVDATWEIDTGVKVVGNTLRKTIWVNWQLATNQNIFAAINESINAGVELGWPYSSCARAESSLVYQDWITKSQQAHTGTYQGPTLHY